MASDTPEQTHLAREVIIRSPVPDDRRSLLDFWERHLTPRVTQLFQWREDASAVSGGNRPYLADDAGQVVGAMNTIAFQAGRMGQLIPAVWQTDVVVAPSHRGKGIVSSLMRHVVSEHPFVLGKGTAAAMHAAKLKFGFREVPHATYLACPLTPLYPMGSIARRARYALGFAASLCRRRAPLEAGLKLSTAAGFSPEFDDLARTLIAGETLAAWKPKSYLEWRYLGCPGRAYRILRADGPEGLRGAAVLRGPEGAERQAWIVDLLADPGDSPTLDALLRGARQALSALGAASIWAFATSPRVRGRLRRAGYLNTSRTPRFTYFVSSTLPFDPAAVEWNFFDGDGDCELYP